MYVVVRIDVCESFKITRKEVYIYSKKSNVKATMNEYYREIKNKYPNSKVVLTTEEKALEAQKKYKEFYDEKERVALGERKRISLADLDKKLNDTCIKELAVEACGRRR